MNRALLVAVALLSAAGCAVPGGGGAGGDDAGANPTRSELDGGVDAGAEVDAGEPDAGGGGQPDAGAAMDAGAEVDAGAPFVIDGIVFVHGINGSSADWQPMIDRFRADGWPADRLIANTYRDPRFGCNDDNALQLKGWVQQLHQAGAQHVAVVAHSMGGLSSRYYVRNLMGTADVEVFTTLGTMHHGLTSPCLSPLPVCVWQQLCATGPFIADLNTAPVTPGPTKWTSIFSDADQTVPMMSSQLNGADNILVMGLAHDGANGLQASELVYQHVLDTLR